MNVQETNRTIRQLRKEKRKLEELLNTFTPEKIIINDSTIPQLKVAKLEHDIILPEQRYTEILKIYFKTLWYIRKTEERLEQQE